MAKSNFDDVLGNWHQLIEGLSASSVECYRQIEAGIAARRIPGVVHSRERIAEGGFGSNHRVYLRVLRGEYRFDICVAPFGSGFFFSWWFARPKAAWLLPTLLVSAAWAVLMMFVNKLLVGVAYFHPMTLLVVPTKYVVRLAIGWSFTSILAFLLAGLAGAVLENAIGRHILAVPGLGWLWRRLFFPDTYYRLDTEAAFRDALHSAVLEVVDKTTQAKGLRQLTEAERKPVLREFYQR